MALGAKKAKIGSGIGVVEGSEQEVLVVAGDQPPPRVMSILFWNARGMGSNRAFRRLYKLVQQKHPLMVFLSETKVHSSHFDVLKVKVGFPKCFCVDSIGRSGGLFLL